MSGSNQLKNKPTLLCDMDQTIADLYPELIRRHNRLFGTKLDDKHWRSYFGDHCINIPEVTRENVDAIFSAGSFFRDLKPIPGAQKALEKLSKHFDIYIVTNPYLRAMRPFLDKYEWLQEYFPKFADKMIATKHKHLVRGALLIDDHMPFCQKWKDIQCSYDDRWHLVASLKYPWTDSSVVDIMDKTWGGLTRKILEEFGCQSK